MHEILVLIIFLVVIGIGLWLINRVPMIDATIKSIINAIVITVVILWLLLSLLNGHFGHIPVP